MRDWQLLIQLPVSNLLSEDGKLVLAANGEIYNHRELRKQFEGKYNFQTESDCEVILALYKEKGRILLMK
jgi:asparagine synthase (glutamine-hydrolysing)